MPQALNRYAATPVGQPGVAEGAGSNGFATSIFKNAASAAISYASALEAIQQSYTYRIITVSRLGHLRFSANSQLLQRGGVSDLFNRVASTGGRGKSAEYVSGLVREIGEDVFEVAEGSNAGRVINLAQLRALGSARWGASYGTNGPFNVTEHGYSTTPGYGVFKPFWRNVARDAAWGAAIGLAIETPFFVNGVLGDPYLTPQQKGLQGGITFAGILGSAGASAWAGAAFGGIPGAVAGIVAGLGYEYFLLPVLIRPAIYQFTGVDPYDRTRELKPLSN